MQLRHVQWLQTFTLAAGLVPVLVGCQGPLSILDPAGPSAAAIAQVWWWMFGVAVVVSVAVIALWVIATRRQGDHLSPDAAQRSGRRWILGGGVALPLVAIVALIVFGTPAGRHHLPWSGAPGAPAPLHVHVIGHQWWWELHYPDSSVRLRNEMRIPTGRPVEVHTRSEDVIHSFWVPRLGGKLDALPGRTLVFRLQADEPGTYRSQCAEFCGTGHAHMTMMVTAMEPAAFEAWVQEQQGKGGVR